MGIKLFNTSCNLFHKIYKFIANYYFYIVVFLIVSCLVLVFVSYEQQESKKELNDMILKESSTQIETINQNIYNSFNMNYKIEDLLYEKIDLLSSLPDFDDYIAKYNHINFLAYADKRGDIYKTDKDDDIFINQNIESVFGISIKDFDDDVVEFGSIVLDKCKDTVYLFGKRINSNKYMLIGYDYDSFLKLRKEIGIGTLIRNIGNYKDIVYLALQDTDGILTATDNINELTAIHYDKFLDSAYKNNQQLLRFIDFNNKQVMEIIKPVIIDSTYKVLTRLAVNLDTYHSINARSVRRTIFVGIGIFVAFTLFILLISLRDRFKILRKSHQKVISFNESILENINDAVFVVNDLGKIVLCNKKASVLFNIRTNSSYSEAFDSDYFEFTNARNSLINIEFKEIAINSKYFAVSSSCMTDENHKLESLIILAKDISKQKEIEAKLQIKEKHTEMGKLAGSVAHEIRNPLNAINLIVQRFEYEFEPVDQKDTYYTLVKTVKSEVQRVNQIIVQFLEFSRPKPLNLEPHSINEIINTSINLMLSLAAAKGIEIVFNSDKNYIVECDISKIKQVIINLIQNAIDASESSTKIDIAAKIQNQLLAISIKDQGCGINDDIKNKIFNLYFSTKSTGSGLGLSIVYQIISEHNWSIRFESMANSGTTFIIEIPLQTIKQIN